MTPYFSIVIPTYNREALIKNTIQSVLAQSFSNFELIIVDDGSTDNTEEVVKPFLCDHVFYYKKKNEERAAARNFGTNKARGQYINWFDSDDIMLPHHLQTAKTFIDTMKMPEVFATLYELVDNHGNLIFREKFISQEINDRFINYNCVACDPVFVRRDIALQFPFNINPGITQLEDYELWLRLAARYRFFQIDKITLKMIQHETRSQTIISKQYEKMSHLNNKFIQTVKSDESIRNFMRNRFGIFASNIYCIGAYSFASAGEKKGALLFLVKCFWYNPFILMKVQFYSVIKKLFFNKIHH